MVFFLFLLHYFSGYYRMECASEDVLHIINLLMTKDIAYWKFRRTDNGRGNFYICKRKKKLLDSVMTPEITTLRIVREFGFPYLVLRYRKRWGIAAGALLFSVITWISGQFVWDIDLVGNETISNVTVYETLKSLGCGVGSFIPSMDLYRVCNDCLLKDPRIAWISVNMEGTVAHVEMIEKKYRSSSELSLPDDACPSNLVASRDGMIVRWEIAGGQPAVQLGQVVRKGDLLVSGVVEKRNSETGQFRLERSAGMVFAETVKVITVSSPLKTQKKAVREEYTAERTVIFFGKEIKFFENSRNLPAEYDIMKNTERWILLQGVDGLEPIRLPLYLVTDTVCVYETVEVILSEDEAEAEAYRAFRDAYEAETAEMEILSYETESGMNADGTAFEIRCTVYGIENIAEERRIGVSQNGETDRIRETD